MGSHSPLWAVPFLGRDPDMCDLRNCSRRQWSCSSSPTLPPLLACSLVTSATLVAFTTDLTCFRSGLPTFSESYLLCYLFIYLEMCTILISFQPPYPIFSSSHIPHALGLTTSSIVIICICMYSLLDPLSFAHMYTCLGLNT